MLVGNQESEGGAKRISKSVGVEGGERDDNAWDGATIADWSPVFGGKLFEEVKDYSTIAGTDPFPPLSLSFRGRFLREFREWPWIVAVFPR